MISNLPNATNRVFTDLVKGIASVMFVDWSSREYEGEPKREPDAEWELPTHGLLLIEMEDGSLIEVGTSEWCSVRYYRPDGNG